MKYHKIRGIDLHICTAEQKIAYNIAFKISINHGDDFLKIPTQFEKSNTIYNLIKLYTKNIDQNKFNIDAIVCCLNSSLQDYLEHSFIATNYTEIGEFFKANYL